MKKKLSRVIFAVVIFFATALGAMAQNEHERNIAEKFTFEFPTIPSNITSPEERAEYLLIHFWDNFDFNADYSESTLFVEQSLVDFLSVLPYAPTDETVIMAFDILLSKSSTNSALQKDLYRLIDIYLANTDSPMRNDKLYINYLKSSLSQPGLTEADIMRKKDMIDMLSKNMEGELATDFSYKTADGTEHTLLSTLPQESDLILIFFDPNCESCEEVMAEMIKSDNLKKRIDSGEINLLAVYSGNNFSAWKRKEAMLPDTWTVGINENEIEDSELYYFPSLPSIYRLSPDGIIKGKELTLSCILGEN